MLEEVLGTSASYVIRILPAEIIAIIVVMLVLHKTGSLERMATTINMWLRQLVDAEKARKNFLLEIERIEAAHDVNLERIQVESIVHSKAAQDLDQQRLRHDLFEMVKSHIEFLQKEVQIQNEFIRGLHETNTRKGVD